jgi:hypothetical protein
MSEPIFKLFFVKFRENWYQLPRDEQVQLLTKMEAAFERAGAKRPVFCNCSWSAEQWSEFGVEEFPNLAALQQFRQELEQIGWSRYVETQTFLGTKLDHA